MKANEAVRKCAAGQGVSDEEALKQSMGAKVKEFVEMAAEVHAKA